MSEMHYLELKTLLLEQREIFLSLFPKKVPISFIAERTGLTRQAIRMKLLTNYEPEVDFWKENGKILITRTTALQLLKLGKGVESE
ncbi:MAG: type II toxin-antitoxin system VapC family toxin [Arcobacter butzleri]|nr:type II toxin-antitoxin system VapC family toxin [Aliarcobacter butzleri]